MILLDRFSRELEQFCMSIPHVRHAEPSVLLSLADEPWQPSRRLLDLSAQLAAITPGISHPMLK
jgi:hypothetical protein